MYVISFNPTRLLNPGSSMLKSRFSLFLTFVWLTLGYGVVHASIVAFLSSFVPDAWRGNQHFESLVVVDDGDPLIQIYDPNVEARFRRLDGTSVSGIGVNPVQRETLPTVIHREPPLWDNRIAPFLDFRVPSTKWYLIAPPNFGGRAYFVGYDPHSRKLVGYLDTEGFSVRTPSLDKSFPIIDSGFYGVVGSTQSPISRFFAYEPLDGIHLDPQFVNLNAALDSVWILAGGSLYEIRLKSRQVRVLIADRSEMRSLARLSVKLDNQPHVQLLVRTDTGLLIIDPVTEKTESILLDPLPKGASESWCQLSNGRRLHFCEFPAERGISKCVITWRDTDGNIERREEAHLAVFDDTSFPSTFVNLGMCVFLPSPIVPCAACVMISPVLYNGDIELARFYRLLDQLKWWIASTIITGVATGWASRRRERDVFGSSSWHWPILVGICGWFGWIAYICLRPLPARLPQGQWMPARPEPPRSLGTEIFA